jgi:tRNA threonylcarbamoyl adenosine modification protein YeaZ
VLVLAIDTSSPAVTAGVVTVEDDVVEAAVERTVLAPRGHGELLAPSITACLAELSLRPADLAAVVVGTGPGPYTGLRVGMVTAAAVADALAVPVYAVGSLDALGAACADEPALLVATDARRREVYWARYDRGRRATDPAVDRPADVPLDGLTAVAGAAGDLYADLWPQLVRRPEHYPTAVALVRLARDRILADAPGELLSPLYLRRPDAVVPGTPKTVSQ